jgi:hypothetical protein
MLAGPSDLNCTDGRYTDYVHITVKWPGTLCIPPKFVENRSILLWTLFGHLQVHTSISFFMDDLKEIAKMKSL